MRYLTLAALGGLMLSACATSAFATSVTLDACEAIQNNTYVFEMSGKSGLLGTDNQSAIAGRFTVPAAGATGFSLIYQNNWNGKFGPRNSDVTCSPTGPGRGRLTFAGGTSTFKADFVYKTDFDRLVLVRTDNSHAIVGDAVIAPAIPKNKTPCTLLTAVVGGSLDGYRPDAHEANLLRIAFNEVKSPFVEVNDYQTGPAGTRTGNVSCENIFSTAAQLTLTYSGRGTRKIVIFPGGAHFDEMPAIEPTTTRHESGWLYVQPDPIEIPG